MQKIDLEKLKKEITNNLSVKNSLDCRSSSTKIIGNLQHLLSLSPDLVDRSSFEILLTHCLAAEKTCPGSGSKFLQSFSSGRRQIDDISVRSKEDILEILESQYFSHHVLSVLKYVLDLVTSKTRISLKKSASSKIFVEISEGYKFECNRPIRVPDLEIKNARVCCIDGFIENIAEIHHLLTYFSESRQDCLLFIRGASNDVLNTIKVNYDRRTLSLIPYIVSFDLESVNTLVDLAVVSGTDVVSSTKGQTISSIKPENLGNVEFCYASQSSLILRNSPTSERVKLHVKQLQEKLEVNTESQTFLTKRISSLASSCIDINIPDDINFFSTSSQFDVGIRILSSIINKTYNPNKVANSFYDSWISQTIDCEQFIL